MICLRITKLRLGGYKMKPITFSTEMVQAILDGRKTQTRRVIKPQPPDDVTHIIGPEKCRYQPDQILYVRETFCEVLYRYERIPINGGHITVPKFAYKADSEVDYTGIWQSPVCMPKEAARLFLKVKDVRVEQLWYITDKDAWAEGCNIYRIPSPIVWFCELWDRTYAERGFPWKSNPWVFVIEFERIKEGGK